MHGDVFNVLGYEIRDLELEEDIKDIKRKLKAAAARRDARTKPMQEAGIAERLAPPPPKHVKVVMWPVGGFFTGRGKSSLPTECEH